jgi:hypothetical protein
MDDKIITFESYYDPMLAEIIKARLEANGIDCFVADSNTIGANPLFNNAIGGVKIKIFERDLEKCKQILAEHEDLPLTEESPTEADTNVRYGSATVNKTTFLGAVISFLTFTYPVIANKAWHCFNCGKDFE